MGNKGSDTSKIQDWLETDFQRSRKRPLGDGSFGEVLKADHTPFGRPLAVKKIDLTRPNNRLWLENFKLEGEVMSGMDHPNILKCHYYGEYQDDFYMVVDYCNSGTLEDYLQRKPDLSLEEALHIFSRILVGFTRLRDSNVIHKDIKPENILFKDDEPVIADFGLCQIGKEKSETPGGTPLYQAPETYFPELIEKYDHDLIDVWSLGCLLYYMLFRVEPFEAENMEELEKVVKKMAGRCLKLPESRSVPRRVQELLKYMLTINPNERCTWEELLDPQLLSGDLTISMVKMPDKYKPSLEMLRTSSSLSRVQLSTVEQTDDGANRETENEVMQEKSLLHSSFLSVASDPTDDQPCPLHWLEGLKKLHRFMLHTSRQLMKVANKVNELGVQRDMYRIASILALRKVIQTCDQTMDKLKLEDSLGNFFDREEATNNPLLNGYQYCAEMKRRCQQLIRHTVKKSLFQFDNRTKALLGELNNNSQSFESQLDSFLKHELCIYRLKLGCIQSCSPETRISIACGLTFLYFTIESDELLSLGNTHGPFGWESFNKEIRKPSFLTEQLNIAFEKYRNF